MCAGCSVRLSRERMPAKPDENLKIEEAMEREAPLHAKYKRVESDLEKLLLAGKRASRLPGMKGIPPVIPPRGDVTELEAVTPAR